MVASPVTFRMMKPGLQRGEQIAALEGLVQHVGDLLGQQVHVGEGFGGEGDLVEEVLSTVVPLELGAGLVVEVPLRDAGEVEVFGFALGILERSAREVAAEGFDKDRFVLSVVPRMQGTTARLLLGPVSDQLLRSRRDDAARRKAGEPPPPPSAILSSTLPLTRGRGAP
ncbi:hypothetical protein [Streptomyces lydicus]|uniref:hypothetical protein n=1 Tax=Streptomyces lydicus TaxID=47763 RepID=UPI00286FF9C4|nr:hypothetical protein [Streptomyces lydicus]